MTSPSPPLLLAVAGLVLLALLPPWEDLHAPPSLLVGGDTTPSDRSNADTASPTPLQVPERSASPAVPPPKAVAAHEDRKATLVLTPALEPPAALPTTGVIVGVVYDQHDRAISGATVTEHLSMRTRQSDGRPNRLIRLVPCDAPTEGLSRAMARRLGYGRTTRTDSAGRFRLAGLRRGTIVLKAAAPGYVARARQLTVALEDAPRVRFLLRAAPMTLEGRALSEDGSPIPGAHIHATPMHDAGDCGASADGAIAVALPDGDAVTDAQGRFRIDGLAGGPFDVSAAASGHLPASQHAVAARARGVTLILPRAASMAGYARDAQTGVPVSLTHLHAVALDAEGRAGRPRGQVRTVPGADEGAWRLTGLPAGRYRVEGRAAGYASSTSDPLTLDAGESVSDIALRMERGGTIEGRMVALATGSPIRGALVRIEADLGQSVGGAEDTLPWARSDAEGVFRLSHVRAGARRLRVTHDGWVFPPRPRVQVHDGRTHAIGRVALVKPATVRGTVRDPSGAANQRYVHVLQERTGEVRTVISEVDGSFEVRSLLPGRVRVLSSDSVRPPQEAWRGHTRAVLDAGRPTHVVLVAERARR